MKKNRKGFTLAELLIVVAIIAVLVAISIPIFTTQLEKSREATDLANIRAACAEVMVSALDEEAAVDGVEVDEDNGIYSKEVALVQTQDGWQTDTTDLEICGIKYSQKSESKNSPWRGDPEGNGACTISYSETKGLMLNFDSLNQDSQP